MFDWQPFWLAATLAGSHFGWQPGFGQHFFLLPGSYFGFLKFFEFFQFFVISKGNLSNLQILLLNVTEFTILLLFSLLP